MTTYCLLSLVPTLSQGHNNVALALFTIAQAAVILGGGEAWSGPSRDKSYKNTRS